MRLVGFESLEGVFSPFPHSSFGRKTPDIPERISLRV